MTDPAPITTSDITIGYVQHVGDDIGIARAARVSTGRVTAHTGESPAGLIDYLMRHRHGTPFEHSSLTVRVHAPIFVFREWHRHRVQSFSEESGRYKTLDGVFWVPGEGRPIREPEGFKPARPELEVGEGLRTWAVAVMEPVYVTAWGAYRELMERGVAREVARAVLPVGLYSSMYATANLREWLHFLSLRTRADQLPAGVATFPSYPQQEIHDAATQVGSLVDRYWPLAWAAFNGNGRVAP